MPTAKEIIIRLINEKQISGEEAYVLLNAILQSEMMEAWKVLDESKKSSKKKDLDWLPMQGVPYTTSPYTTSTGITWTGGTGTLTGVTDANYANATTAISSELYNALTASK